MCRVTIVGIVEINPAFFHNKLKYLIGELVSAGGRKSLMEYADKEFQMCTEHGSCVRSFGIDEKDL